MSDLEEDFWEQDTLRLNRMAAKARSMDLCIKVTPSGSPPELDEDGAEKPAPVSNEWRPVWQPANVEEGWRPVWQPANVEEGWRPVENAFCPTGEGGGQDNSCSRYGSSEVQTPNTSMGTLGMYRHEGKWDKSREAIHKEIRDMFYEKVKGSPLKEGVVYMTGGGFGSGKSTFLDHFPKEVGFPTKDKVPVMDPDAAKQKIPEMAERAELGDKGAASYVHEESSEVAKEEVSKAIKQGLSLIYDTSGDSNPDKLHNKVQKMRDEGAKRVVIQYATPLSFDEAIRRVEYRQAHAKGIKRELSRAHVEVNHREVSRCWMASATKGTFDEQGLWSTVGKMGDPPLKIAEAKQGKITVFDKEKFDMFVKMGE